LDRLSCCPFPFDSLSPYRQVWHLTSRQRDIYKEAAQQTDPKHRLSLAAYATRRQWETGASMMTIYQGAAAAECSAGSLYRVYAYNRVCIHEYRCGWQTLPPALAIARLA
jgi:hypothetical protein